MIRLGNTSFFVRMVFTLTIVLVLLGATSIIQTRGMMNNLFVDQQEKRGLSVANMLSARAANLILVNNYYDLHELAKDTQNTNDDVRYVFIVNDQGDLLAHSFTSGFPRNLLEANFLEMGKKFSVVEISTEDGLVRDFAVPIFDGRLGAVHIGLSDASLRSTIHNTTKQLMIDTFLAVLVGIIITTMLTRHLFRPITELVKITSAITSGDLSQRVKNSSTDELGKLAYAFNAMTNYLQNSIQELKQKEEARTHFLISVILYSNP